MDQILLGILKSDKELRVKSAFVRKIKQNGTTANPESVVLGMLTVTSNHMLSTSSLFEQDACKDVFKTWALYNVGQLPKFCHEQFICRLLLDRFRNSSNVVWLLRQCMQLLWKDQCIPHFRIVSDIVRLRAVGYIKEISSESDGDCSVIASFCELLLHFKQCIPQGEQQVLLCGTILNTVAAARKPSDKTIKLYIHQVNNQMGQLLYYIWQQGDHKTITVSLLNIFRIISFIDPSREVTPSVALAGLVQYLPTSVIDKVTKDTANDPSIQDLNMQTAIHRMILWLAWPGAQNIDKWVIAFLQALVTSHKYTLFIQVVETSIEQIFDRMRFDKIRLSCFNVLEYMLLTFRHSPEPFHKVVGKVHTLVEQLKRENDATFLEKLANLLACLMHLHPGFPDLYEDLLEDLKGYRLPTQEQIIRRVGQTGKGVELKGATVHTSYVNKSETGKAGLVNMGNTCFMNTIVQTLYMCDRFRRRVFSHVTNPKEPLMGTLQTLFAYLRLTARPALAPDTFLTASQPAWFTRGSQQDCSEYLRYLFDQLHEQEKTHRSSCKARPDSSTGKRQKQGSPRSLEMSPVVTLIDDAFGGTLTNKYKCLRCKNESHHQESFSDIPLAFPTENDKKKSVKKNGHLQLTLDQLLLNYLNMEEMVGENRYDCKHCKGLQDAERQVYIKHSPNYLILTLLRFSYDVKKRSRSKILTEVNYPRSIHLPVVGAEKGHRSPRDKNNVRLDTYALVTVIVHSGMGSDCGHYYCYARHSNPAPPEQSSGHSKDYLEDKWFLFNDSRITFSNFKTFSSVSQSFRKDTPYVLVYKKIAEGDRAMEDTQMSLDESTDAPVKTELWQKVERDNRIFSQEQEQQQQKKALWQDPTSDKSWYKRDDNDPPGSCGGRGGFTEGARLVF